MFKQAYILVLAFIAATPILASDEIHIVTGQDDEVLQIALDRLQLSFKPSKEINDSDDAIGEDSPIITDFLKVNPVTAEQANEAFNNSDNDKLELCFFSPLPYEEYKQEVSERLENKINLFPYEDYLKILYQQGVVKLAHYNNKMANERILDAFGARVISYGIMKGVSASFMADLILPRQSDHIISALETAIDSLKLEPDPAMLPDFTYQEEELADSDGCTIM